MPTPTPVPVVEQSKPAETRLAVAAVPEPSADHDPFKDVEFDLKLATQPGSEGLTMSTIEVAELTGKRHDNILRDVRAMEKKLKVIFLKTEGKSTGGRGRPSSVYHLGREHVFTLLCGYSHILANKVVRRWLELEGQSQGQEPVRPGPTQKTLPQNYTQAVRALLETLEQNDELQSRVTVKESA